MATSMIRRLGTCKLLRSKRFHDFYRTILSDAYKSEQIWKDRLTSPFLDKINAKKFGIELLRQFEESKTLTSVDVDLFANKIQDLGENFEYIAKELLLRYRHCDTSVPIKDSIMHAVVRGYIEGGFVHKLIPLIKDKWQYGVFPDDQSMCLLLDHLLEKKDYQGAAQIAYEVMLQEEYDHQLKNILALSAAVQHYSNTMDLERKEPEPVTSSEDVEYIPVKVIRNPYYDDHFDIKDERFLLGKTLYYLSKNTKMLNPVLSRSLQLIGLGLYDKFESANQLLADWLKDSSLKVVVYSEAIKQYEDFLQSAPTRDADAEPVDMGDKTLDDEIELLKLTPAEKVECISKFESLKSSMKENQTHSENIVKELDTFFSRSDFKGLQKLDEKIMSSNYKNWVANWKVEIEKYRAEVAKQQKLGDIHNKLNALQEREELLSFFDNEEIIQYLYSQREKTKKEEQVVEEEYVAPPGLRNVKMTIKKRK